MPRIPDYITDCSVYLYPSEADAMEGSKYGGSGFLVHVRLENNPSIGFVYAITNKHVVGNGCCVLRLNRKDGGIDTIKTTYSDWHVPFNGDDVAVYSIDLGVGFRWWSVGVEDFLTHEKMDIYRFGIGDEAFLVGRLVNHEGRQKNTPIVRFGNVSLMADPSEPIRFQDNCGNIREQECFLVECRSLSGFSGSPVFVSTTQYYRGEAGQRIFDYERAKHPPQAGDVVIHPPFDMTAGPFLMGIDCGHTSLWSPVFKGQEKTDLRVELNSGIACVLPAWKIAEILNLEELVKERRKEDKKLTAEREREILAINDISSPETPEFTKDAFESALTRVSRKVKPE